MGSSPGGSKAGGGAHRTWAVPTTWVGAGGWWRGLREELFSSTLKLSLTRHSADFQVQRFELEHDCGPFPHHLLPSMSLSFLV